MSADWMPPKRASLFVGKSVKTLANMRSLGTGPAYMKDHGGSILYDAVELERWRESQIAEHVETRDSRRAGPRAVAA